MATETGPFGMQIRNGSFRLANDTIVNIPSLDVPTGGLLIVAGPNGGGKTSLATYLCGLRRELPGERSSLPTMCWQQPELVPGSLDANLELVRGGRKWALAANASVEPALRYTDLLPIRKSSAASLSGGEAQRLNTARAFLTSKFGMVLDEPSASLDYHGIDLLVDGLEAYLNRRPPTDAAKWIAELDVRRRFVILITHDRMLIERLASFNPRFVAIDQNTVRNDANASITVDAHGGEGYSLAEVTTRPPSLFWAEFFNARNLFYTTSKVPVDSLLQLRRSKGATGWFVVIPGESIVVVKRANDSGAVHGQIGEVDEHGGQISLRVEFQNDAGEFLSIWAKVKTGRQAWMKVNGDVSISMNQSLAVTPQIANGRKG